MRKESNSLDLMGENGIPDHCTTIFLLEKGI
jgi:hypothetical protein